MFFFEKIHDFMFFIFFQKFSKKQNHFLRATRGFLDFLRNFKINTEIHLSNSCSVGEFDNIHSKQTSDLLARISVSPPSLVKLFSQTIQKLCYFLFLYPSCSIRECDSTSIFVRIWEVSEESRNRNCVFTVQRADLTPAKILDISLK